MVALLFWVPNVLWVTLRHGGVSMVPSILTTWKCHHPHVTQPTPAHPLSLPSRGDKTVNLAPEALDIQTWNMGNSLAVQWLGLLTFTAKGLGSISGQGTKTPRAM